VLALVRAIDDAFGTSTPVARIEEAAAELNATTDQAVASAPALAATVTNLEQEYDWIRGAPTPKSEEPTQSLDLPSGPELVAELERFLRAGGGPTAGAA
jgi:hypothetical protein